MKHPAAAAIALAAMGFPLVARAQSGVPAQPYSPSATELALEPPPPPPQEQPDAPEIHDTPPAPPPAPKRFGDEGTFVFSGASSISFGATSYSGGPAESSSVVISPGMDIFIANQVSLGIDVSYWRSHGRGFAYDNALVTTDSHSFGAGVRFGVNIPLGASFSWYLRATLGYATRASTSTVVATPSNGPGGAQSETTDDGAYLVLYAPLLAHVAPHFFVGFGPSVRQDLSNSSNNGQDVKGTGVGASLVVGGWL